MAVRVPYTKFKFRRNNKFLSVEEYKKIKEIGDKKFISEEYKSFNKRVKSDPDISFKRKGAYVFYVSLIWMPLSAYSDTLRNDILEYIGWTFLILFVFTIILFMSHMSTSMSIMSYKADLRYFFKTHYEMVKNTKSYEDYKLVLNN
tara:strand:- start:8 stop:445 length:438 start_codon:yes stop_codon:yes gene_type:complete